MNKRDYENAEAQRKSDNVEAGCSDYEQASDRDADNYPDDDEAAKNNDKQYGGK